MADIKLSALYASSPAAALTGLEIWHLAQGSPYASRGVTAEQIKDFVLTAAMSKSGDTGTGTYYFLGTAHTPQAGATGTFFHLSNEGDTSRILFDNYQSSNGGANLTFRKARGTGAAPSALAINDQLINIAAFGYGTSAYCVSTRAGIVAAAGEAWTNTEHGSYMYFHSTPVGTAATVEHLRLYDNHVRLGATAVIDLQMGGSNTVIDSSRHFHLRSYTVGTLPSASPAGQMIYVSDAQSRSKLAISDGTDWNYPDGPLTTHAPTASYVLVLSDGNSRLIRMNVASANNLEVPPNSSVAFEIGTVITFSQHGAGQTTVLEGAGVTVRSANGLKLRAQYSVGTLVKIATDVWLLSGDTTT